MSANAEAGRALELLRKLGGLSRGACAERAGLRLEELTGAEEGHNPGALQRLAAFHGVDPEELTGAIVRPADDASAATVFLLHSAYQDFDAADLAPLTRALHGARVLAALDLGMGGGRTATRLAMGPVSCAGPQPRDAAMQGYRLARRVRDDLRLGDAPLDDLPALCEQRLGVAVTRAQISTEGLRAASILDAERAAAAAVLSMDDLELSNNPRLTRVCLAHELCHLLFDPTKPGSVQVALDDADSAKRTAKPSPGALLESRAKGFAAEFLIPHRGVSALLGGRADATTDRAEARQRVSLVREHFDTPWKIASLHLGNLGWIDRGLAQQMGDEGAGGGVSRPLSSLLCDDETPLLAQKLLTTHPLDASLPADVLTRDDPPAWLDGVRATAAANARDALDLCLARAREALNAGRPRAAAFAVGERLDDYLLDADWPAAAALLDAIDVTEFPPAVLTAALVATRPVPDALQRTRTAFVGRAIEAMRARGALSEAELADIESRLR